MKFHKREKNNDHKKKRDRIKENKIRNSFDLKMK